QECIMLAREAARENRIARLRRDIAGIDSGRPASTAGHAVLPLGIAGIDRALAGGLRRDGLHEIRSAASSDFTAASGFAFAILARLAETEGRPFLFVTEAGAENEAGLPYGPGLNAFGLAMRRLIVVRVRRPGEALWVFEEGLRCPGLAAVLAEIHGRPRQLDLTASRRLALRAGESGVIGLLLRQAAPAEPGAGATRWHVSARPAGV